MRVPGCIINDMSEHDKQPKQPLSEEYKRMKEDVPRYMKDHGIPPARFNYWQAEIDNILRVTGNRFEAFENDNDDLLKIGDELLRNRLATGYNLLPDGEDMKIGSDEPLIFYNCHLGRTWHFGLLIAEMEDKGLIDATSIALGKKATKVLFSGWPIVPEDEIEDGLLSSNADKVLKTVEMVLTIKPRAKTRRILEYLSTYAKADDMNPLRCIPGSWYVPDIRGTLALNSILKSEKIGGFDLVTSNIFHGISGASLVTLRKLSALTNEALKTPQNADLVVYLTEFGVPE